jgi:serine/threonine protein kinase
MKLIINKKYEFLRDWIEQLPSIFKEEGKLVYKGRNIIKIFNVNGLDINVKQYHKPLFFNRIAYTFFRKSKAFRAFYNPLRIAEKGFDSAESIAFIEIYGNGLLSDSYYISIHCRDVEEIRKYFSSAIKGNEDIIDAFARYTAALHDAGIYHLDYSPGNILFRRENGEYSFLLVDTNRMKFTHVSPDMGCRNFARLFDKDEMYERIAAVYSQSRKEPFRQDEAASLMLKYRKQYLKGKAEKKRFLNLFKKR